MNPSRGRSVVSYLLHPMAATPLVGIIRNAHTDYQNCRFLRYLFTDICIHSYRASMDPSRSLRRNCEIWFVFWQALCDAPAAVFSGIPSYLNVIPFISTQSLKSGLRTRLSFTLDAFLRPRSSPFLSVPLFFLFSRIRWILRKALFGLLEPVARLMKLLRDVPSKGYLVSRSSLLLGSHKICRGKKLSVDRCRLILRGCV